MDSLVWRTFTEPFGSNFNDGVSGLFINARGELVAWGSTQRNIAGDAERGTAFWTSTDGISWRQSMLGDSEEDPQARDISSGAQGYAAVGETNVSAAAWWSADGETWSRSTITPTPGRDEEVILAVAAGTEGFLAVGGEGDERSRAVAWFSPTGEEWTRLEVDLQSGWFEDVAAAPDGGYVVVGIDLSHGRPKATAWRVSRDGLDWQQAEWSDAIGGPGEDHLYNVWSYAGGYVAFGLHADADDTISCKGCYFDPALWRTYTSLDGMKWNRNELIVGNDLAPAHPWYGAVELWADGLLAVGRATDKTRRVWFSSDGIDWTPVGDPVVLAGSGIDSADAFDLLVADNYVVIGGLSPGGGFVMIGTSVP
jgi:hypothetical protein